MGISKKIRELVYLKYDKHCSYCGKELKTIKEMQIDHLEPKYYRNFIGRDENGMPQFKDPDRIENLMPSCRRCNHYKRANSLNFFRSMIDTLHERIRKNYITKVAEDFGLIKFKEFDGLFYFEKFN